VIHLAILQEPYLTMLIDGRKTCESRFSLKRIAPYNQIEIGDLVYFKRSSGPIIAKAIVKSRLFKHLEGLIIHKNRRIDTWNPNDTAESLFKQYNHEICATPEYMESKQTAKFATLIWFEKIEQIKPFEWKQAGQQGWIGNWQVPTNSDLEEDEEDEEDDDEISQAMLEDALAEEQDLLKEEQARRKKDGWKYRYQCAHCAFQAEFFHQITIHMMKNKKCRKAEHQSPCYPIFIHQPTGAPIP
jgi:ASC-1-like (ASCH) protein